MAKLYCFWPASMEGWDGRSMITSSGTGSLLPATVLGAGRYSCTLQAGSAQDAWQLTMALVSVPWRPWTLTKIHLGHHPLPAGQPPTSSHTTRRTSFAAVLIRTPALLLPAGSSTCAQPATSQAMAAVNAIRVVQRPLSRSQPPPPKPAAHELRSKLNCILPLLLPLANYFQHAYMLCNCVCYTQITAVV